MASRLCTENKPEANFDWTVSEPQSDNGRIMTVPDAGLCCTERKQASDARWVGGLLHTLKWLSTIQTINRLWTRSGPAVDPQRAKSGPWARHGQTRNERRTDMRWIHSEYTAYHELAIFSFWNMRKPARWSDTASYLVQSGRARFQTMDCFVLYLLNYYIIGVDPG